MYACYVHAYVCTYVHVYVCMYICMYLPMYIHINVHTYIHFWLECIHKLCIIVISISYYTVTAGVPAIVPNATVDDNSININGTNVTLTLSWGEPFNNFDPIMNYTVSCSGDILCPQNFITTDNTTRSYTITNLTTMTNYTFSVVATNSIGIGEAAEVNITTPGEVTCGYLIVGLILLYCHSVALC